ncbi:hypothetical protein I3760_15G006200 [Carya illinoinensis]|nr:hypothetical protein I3760_15G006200 [Carya illinoinensis]
MASQVVASESFGISLQMRAREVNDSGNVEIRYVGSCRELMRNPNGGYTPIHDNFNYLSIPAVFIRVPPQVLLIPEWHQRYLNSMLCLRLNLEDAPLRATVAEHISSFALQHQAVSLDLAPNGGASRSAIIRLMEKGSFVASKSDDQELGMCSICLEEFASSNGAEELLRMDCSHVYHRACILPWLQKSNTCPACRRQVD